MNELAQVFNAFANLLERIGIRYAIGGSVASSARGQYRATNDVDMIAAVAPAQADRLAKELGPEWYADADQMRAAIAAKRAFNLIHMKLGLKVDIFPATEEFHQSQLERASRIKIPFLGDSTLYPVTTAEDILLAKLRWYRDGGEVSEVQWKDISMIVAKNPLDRAYLENWAARLGVADLLDRALASR